jgi:PAS domain S-box-containing protein
VDEAPGAREYATKSRDGVRGEVRQHRRKDGSFLFAEVSTAALAWGDTAARVALVHDITDRVRAEEDMKETLAELNTIQQAAPVGILLVSNRVIIRSNDALTRMTGYSREELAWKPANVLCLSEDDAQKFWDVAEPQISRTGRYACDRPIRCKDGTTRWARLVGRAIDRTELWKGAIWIIEDLEEARTAQAALARLAEDLAQAQRVGRLGSWSRNFDTGEVIYTAEQSRLFGLDPGEPPPNTVDEFLLLVHEEDRAAMAAAYDRIIRTGEAEDLDIRAARAGDGERWLHVSMRGERDANGHVFRAFGINQDITESVKARDLLEQSRDFYRSLFEKFPTLVWRTDPNRACTFVNAFWTEYTGLPVEQALGRGWDDVTHPDDIDLCHEVYGAHFDARTPVVTEYRLRKPDGGYRWVRDCGAPYYDADGRYAGFVGACFDITDQKAAEQALRQSEARLKTILEHMPVMLDAFDGQGNIIAWNRECERVTGYPGSEIIGNPKAMELLYPDAAYRNEMLEKWKARDNDYRDWEWTLTARDGSPRTVLWSNRSRSFPVEGWATWGTGVDITDWRRAEARLEESEKRFRSIIDVAGDGIFVADLDGNILDFNRAACDSLGYTCEELQRMNVRELDSDAARLSPEDLRRFHEQAMKSAVQWEGNHRRKDGTTFPVQVRIAGVRIANQEFVVGIARNVAEQKRMAQDLAASESRFRALIEKSTDVLAVTDDQGVLRYSGPSVQDILGIPSGSLLGTSAFGLVHPDDVPRARQILGELLADPGVVARATLRVRHASGSWREMDFVARNLLDDPAVGGIVINARDVTGRA